MLILSYKCNTFVIQGKGSYGLRVRLMVLKTETINVRVPGEIATWIDSLVEKKLFSSRSEVIRHFVREYVQEQKGKSTSSKSLEIISKQRGED